METRIFGLRNQHLKQIGHDAYTVATDNAFTLCPNVIANYPKAQAVHVSIFANGTPAGYHTLGLAINYDSDQATYGLATPIIDAKTVGSPVAQGSAWLELDATELARLHAVANASTGAPFGSTIYIRVEYYVYK